jgi:surface protein
MCCVALTDDFVITIKTDNAGTSGPAQFTIPTTGTGYNYNVDCDNNGTDEFTGATGSVTCDYGGVAGTYTIRIKDNSGVGTGFPRIFFNNGGDRLKLLTIEQWGTGSWTSMASAFQGCANLAGQASDAPNLANVTDMSGMFLGASAFNQDIGGWNTANVTNMRAMFLEAGAFNQNIGGWNTANVTNMRWMFYLASAFNQNIGGWNTANVTDMSGMFRGASAFNQDIGGWNTANVTDMSSMFQATGAFNQNIGGWNTANVTDMSAMFLGAGAFNQNIGGWTTGNVTNMGQMFSGASAFNQDIGGWTTGNVTNMSRMFSGAGAFNQNIGGWNTSNVTDMSRMFSGAGAFNQNIGGWNTANVTDMSWMFLGAGAFNQNIGGWNTGNVTNMSGMFSGAGAFNQNIGGWNTANVTDMSWMFADASAFNQNIGGWNTANVTNMSQMFRQASAFNQNIGGWTTGNVTNMSNMFYLASAFNQNIGGWNTANVTNMSQMFRQASAFNQNIGGWNTANVTNMGQMFRQASAFNQNIGGWNVSALTNVSDMFIGATLSTANYDALLMGWNAQSLNSGVSFHGGNSHYCLGEDARIAMTSAPTNWIITDGGKECGVVWDGGGLDNNWSTGANWVGNAAPMATDNVVFDGTSSKDAVIDIPFGSAVGGVIITDGYNGRISFAGPLAVDGYYNQNGGTVIVNPTHTFTVDGAFNHTGGALQEERSVNNANVPFLEIRNSDSSMVKYRGVEVDTAANLGNTVVTVRAVDTAAGEYCTDTGAASPDYAERCYIITPTTNGAAMVRLWALTSELNGILEGDLSVYRHTGTSTWGALTTNRLTGNDGGSYSYAEGDTAGFSAFLLGDANNEPTAVTLSNIAAQSSSGVNWLVVLTLALGLTVSVGYLARKRQIGG